MSVHCLKLQFFFCYRTVHLLPSTKRESHIYRIRRIRPESVSDSNRIRPRSEYRDHRWFSSKKRAQSLPDVCSCWCRSCVESGGWCGATTYNTKRILNCNFHNQYMHTFYCITILKFSNVYIFYNLLFF